MPLLIARSVVLGDRKEAAPIERPTMAITRKSIQVIVESSYDYYASNADVASGSLAEGGAAKYCGAPEEPNDTPPIIGVVAQPAAAWKQAAVDNARHPRRAVLNGKTKSSKARVPSTASGKQDSISLHIPGAMAAGRLFHAL